MLEPTRPLVASLQGRLVEVYLMVSRKLKKVSSPICRYAMRLTHGFNARAKKMKVRVSELVGGAEEHPCFCSKQGN